MHYENPRTGLGAGRRRLFTAGAAGLLFLLSTNIRASNSANKRDSQAEQAGPVRRKHVYIVHGYMAQPSDHWFPWLRKRLLDAGFDVDILAMPDSDRPDAIAWDKFLEARIARYDEETFFVAHSLGCISLLRHLASRTETTVGGIVLVSGFSEPLARLPQLDAFIASADMVERARRIASHRTVIAARDDAIVPYEATARLARQWQADLVTVDRCGHFLGSDGFTEFGLVYRRLLAMALSAAALPP